MSKFIDGVRLVGVNAAAFKLFAPDASGRYKLPDEDEAAVLLKHRADLELWNLLRWHATGDDRAPSAEVIQHLRGGGLLEWRALSSCFESMPRDRLREWLAEAGSAAPLDTRAPIATHVASPLARKVISTMVQRRHDVLLGAHLDEETLRQVLVRYKDDELVEVLNALLRRLDLRARCIHMHLLLDAGVLHAVPDAISLLPRGERFEQADAPIRSIAEAPLGHLAHLLAISWPEQQRAEADAWIVREHLDAIQAGADWVDVFWRVPPRLRARVALESLDLERSLWAPHAGTALAERIAEGHDGLWPRAFAWLETVYSDRVDRQLKGRWVEPEVHVRELLRLVSGRGSAHEDWFALALGTKLAVGPLFPATEADGWRKGFAFLPSLVGIESLERVPSSDPDVDDGWAKIYADDPFAIAHLRKRFAHPLTPRRARALLDLGVERGPLGAPDAIAELVNVGGRVDLARAPRAEQLDELGVVELLAWRAAVGEPFEARIDEWLDRRVRREATWSTLDEALRLGRPLQDDWKLLWRAALDGWSFAALLHARARAPWLATDDELVAIARHRVSIEGDHVFNVRAPLPDCLRGLVAERLVHIDDSALAGRLRAWVSREDPEAALQLAKERLRVRPDAVVCAWWGARLASANKWNTEGIEVLEALLVAGAFDLAQRLVERSDEALRARAAQQPEESKNGRPVRRVEQGKFPAAIHAALATAITRVTLRAIEGGAVDTVDRAIDALYFLEPPPHVTKVFQRLLHPSLPTSTRERVVNLLRIVREGSAQEADLADVFMALRQLAATEAT